MADSARVAVREGLPNALFVVASIERMPPELDRVANALTVLFPWGSLLHGVVRGDARVLAAIARMACPGAELDILVNRSIFDGPVACRRGGISERAFVSDDVRRAYLDAGICVDGIERLDTPLPHVTTWGQRVARDGNVLRLTARMNHHNITSASIS